MRVHIATMQRLGNIMNETRNNDVYLWLNEDSETFHTGVLLSSSEIRFLEDVTYGLLL